ncbi:ketoacyl-ACP synthase III family protein [Streptomyces monashensis]|uniref:Secondary metabolite biosynthesis protein n=1 Tax=Streptomyces monashensis TaxID=1678012 RepID=A0A1S2PSP7_9ACTN|nr:ketoacyl-ACP synthase III family protein [Streptomyces monashensis]OIJ96839.1 secondary metabolite biosynthesis protein [Streptomyces monashensis]
MRWEGVHVAGTGVWLPGPVTARSAMDSGHYDPEQCAADDLLSVRVADEETAPPEMAVQAATTALKRSGLDAGDVELLVHTCIWFQGVDMWPAASYIAGHAVGAHVPAFGLRQECNAGLAAVELAARHLAGAGPTAAAVVTSADRFGEPLIRRWSSEPGFVYADGATALLLSRRGGFARLLSTATEADNSLEAVVRGSGFRPNPTSEPLDLAGRLGHYAQDAARLRGATERLSATVKRAVARALADADTDMESVARVVVPASGRSRMDWQVQTLFGIPLAKSSWDFARQAGHLGAGDQTAGFDHLVATGALRGGDKVLLVGGGSGFTCTCAVIELTDEPRYGTESTETPS